MPVNPLYAKGYRSLGCEPCTKISTGSDERAGRWTGTGKCGGECGIHTRPLKLDYQIWKGLNVAPSSFVMTARLEGPPVSHRWQRSLMTAIFEVAPLLDR